MDIGLDLWTSTFWLKSRRICLDGYWVGSSDFNFLVEIKLGFPLIPQKVELFAGGSTATKVSNIFGPWLHLNQKIDSPFFPGCSSRVCFVLGFIHHPF